MVTIDFYTTLASVERHEWSCPDEDMLTLLKLLSEEVPTGPSVADLDFALASHAVRALGGRIIRADPPPEMVPGRIY